MYIVNSIPIVFGVVGFFFVFCEPALVITTLFLTLIQCFGPTAPCGTERRAVEATLHSAKLNQIITAVYTFFRKSNCELAAVHKQELYTLLFTP